MAAYILVEMGVTDPVGILEYRKLAEAPVAKYGADSSCAAAKPNEARLSAAPR